MWTHLALFSTFWLYTHSQTIDCVCVAYYLCVNNTVITDGGGLLDERLGPSCGTCNCEGLEVCCALPNSTPTPNPSTTACGFTNPNGVGSQNNPDSTNALFGEYPWMVQIYENGNYRCGGSLIHPSVVLTAAHCVKNQKSTFMVRAGEWDSSSTDELYQYQDRKVSSVKSHEKFNPSNYHNDVALIFLEEAFELRPHINVACLPPEGGVMVNGRCYSTGWGSKAFGDGNSSAVLKKVDLAMIEKGRCQEMFRKTRLGAYYKLHESFVCAGGEDGKDTCTGDGGGPLVCPIDGQENRYQQVGIVSWGVGCNEKDYPGGYTDVGVLRKWIDNQIKQKSLGTAGYQYQ